MIGKIITIVIIGVISFLGLSNVFKFQSQETTSSSQIQPLNQTNQTQIPILQPKSWLDGIEKWFWELIQNFSNYITSYFKKIFPNSTPTFGLLITLLVFLIFFWILAAKFENAFRAILLVAILIVFVFLIMSAVGFV